MCRAMSKSPRLFSPRIGRPRPARRVFPHTLIVAGENSKINFLDYYGSAFHHDSAWVAGAATIIAGRGREGLPQKRPESARRRPSSYQCDTTICGRDAEVKNIAVHLGAKRARYESYSKLAGPGAHLELCALTIASGDQEFDQRTFQDHAAPRATSNLLYKNALLDQARTIFAGMIRVEPAAEETDAYQQNRNLLLNPAAEADSLPGLEIHEPKRPLHAWRDHQPPRPRGAFLPPLARPPAKAPPTNCSSSASSRKSSKKSKTKPSPTSCASSPGKNLGNKQCLVLSVLVLSLTNDYFGRCIFESGTKH